jgi:hypothetical protein
MLFVLGIRSFGQKFPKQVKECSAGDLPLQQANPIDLEKESPN